MKNWKTSLYGQIIYMAGVGLGLLAIPQMLSTLLHLGPVSEIWVRIVGVLALLLCYYYWQSIRNESAWFAKASCIGRYFFVTCLALLAFYFGIYSLIALAMLELLLALWTQWTLAQKQ